MRLSLHQHVEVNEDGQLVLRISVPDAKEAGVELIFDTIVLTRAQSAKLADDINAAQGRAK